MQRRYLAGTPPFLTISIATIVILSIPSAASKSSQLIHIGNEYLDIGRYKDALNAFDKALEKDPNNTINPHFWCSNEYSLKNWDKYQEASKAYKAIELTTKASILFGGRNP